MKYNKRVHKTKARITIEKSETRNYLRSWITPLSEILSRLKFVFDFAIRTYTIESSFLLCVFSLSFFLAFVYGIEMER